MKSRISPDEPFPEDLGGLKNEDVEVLNSKVHREVDHEFATEGEVDPETAARKDEITDELDGRDAGPGLSLVPQHDEDDEDDGGAVSANGGH
ncbi:hypothetical protein [Arthrobacter sp. L77]|uniref:hypothetical protein n=1 Tax=Arthrobacter sp. L77 TaxID=1496689 RepID=UPI000A79AEC8|nr:hypothetical protein [Arthrobacter sp. L77]